MSNLLSLLVGRDVTVLADDGLKVSGRLIRYAIPNGRRPHKPFLLILLNRSGDKVIVRQWNAVATKQKEASK